MSRWQKTPERTRTAPAQRGRRRLQMGLKVVLAWMGVVGSGAAFEGCGGVELLEVRPIEQPRQVPSAPPQTAEERDGEVPPLRGMPPKRALVPVNLVPPAPPDDPQPDFEPQGARTAPAQGPSNVRSGPEQRSISSGSDRT